jgi:hypothetical protein
MASGFSAQTGGQRHKTKVKLRRFAVISAISLPQRGSKSANELKGTGRFLLVFKKMIPWAA